MNVWNLPTRRLGQRVLVFDCLESTNTQAAKLAQTPNSDGLVILAREQTAGRGQQGRSWLCPAGMGVLLSVVLSPPVSLRRPAILTTWAAVAVCATISETTGREAVIKWPNDVLLEGRKVCGILIEQGRATVAGIGLNVNQSEAMLTANGLSAAGSLALVTGQQLDCDEVARRLIGQLDELYDRLCAGEVPALESRWKQRLGLLGEQVVAECRSGSSWGRLRNVSLEAVELEMPDGTTLRLLPETITHLRRSEPEASARGQGNNAPSSCD
jgi:BirA family biotin operon repressor/biotin-[acetyl-CoA-carboxylase] ligase